MGVCASAPSEFSSEGQGLTENVSLPVSASGAARRGGLQTLDEEGGDSGDSGCHAVEADEDEEELEARRGSSREAGPGPSGREGGKAAGRVKGNLLPPLSFKAARKASQVVPVESPGPLQHDSDVVLAGRGQADRSSSKRNLGSSIQHQEQQQAAAHAPNGELSLTPEASDSTLLRGTGGVASSRGGSTSTSTHQQRQVMSGALLRSLGFVQHSVSTTNKAKLKTQPVAVLALEASEEPLLPRGRARNSLVPLHVNAACRSYFGIPGHHEYGQVMLKLLKRDTLLTFAIQKALRNLKRGEAAAVSHVTPDPAGQTSSLLGMRITPCVWKVGQRSTRSHSRRWGSRASQEEEDEVLMPALAIEHNVPYDPAEVVPRLMRDYAVLSHVPAILTLIDFQGKVLYQNAASLTYMGDLLRVKYDNQLADGLLRVLFMYDLHNLDQMLEDVLAGEEWRGVIQVPGSLRRYLAANEGGRASSGTGTSRFNSITSGGGAPEPGLLEPRQPSVSGSAVAVPTLGSNLDVEFQICDSIAGARAAHQCYTPRISGSNGPRGNGAPRVSPRGSASGAHTFAGLPGQPQPPYSVSVSPVPSHADHPQHAPNARHVSGWAAAAEAAVAAYPEPAHINPHTREQQHQLQHYAPTANVPRLHTSHHSREPSWERVGGGRTLSDEGFQRTSDSQQNAQQAAAAPAAAAQPQPQQIQQQFHQRKFMTLLERQGQQPTSGSTRTASRATTGGGGGRANSNNYSEPLAMYSSADLPPHMVGVRPPSNTSLTPSRVDLAHSSTTSNQDTGSLPHVASGRTHAQQTVSTGSEIGRASHAGPLANNSLASQGRQLSLEPVEEDESGYGETQVCWHEVHAMSLLDPVLDKQVMMLVQTDVTARVELENKLADLTDAQLSMLEQLFPRHIIEYMLARVPNKGDRNLRDLANMHEQVMVLFCDVVGFTSMSKEVEPSEVMHFLNELYESFDKLVDEYDMYKLDIVGDCYIVVAGLIKEDQDGFVCVDEMDDGEVTNNAVRIMQFAKAMLRESQPVLMPHNSEPVQLRIGIHTGPLVSGLVGAKMPKFTLFGDTMNTASRMETCCKPGCIHVSDAFANLLPHEEWNSTGGVQVKGKGMMQTYLWEANPATQQDLSRLDQAMAATSLQLRANSSGNASLRSHFTGRSSRSRYTRRRSRAGSDSDSEEDGSPGSGHPLLTILTNIRGGASREDVGVGDGDEGLGVEHSVHSQAFMAGSNRSSFGRLFNRRNSVSGTFHHSHRASDSSTSHSPVAQDSSQNMRASAEATFSLPNQAEQEPSGISSTGSSRPSRTRLPRSQSSLYTRTLSRQASPRKQLAHDVGGPLLRSHPSMGASPFAAAAATKGIDQYSPEHSHAHMHAHGLQQQGSGKRMSMSGGDDDGSVASDVSPKGVLREACRRMEQSNSSKSGRRVAISQMPRLVEEGSSAHAGRLGKSCSGSMLGAAPGQQLRGVLKTEGSKLGVMAGEGSQSGLGRAGSGGSTNNLSVDSSARLVPSNLGRGASQKSRSSVRFMGEQGDECARQQQAQQDAQQEQQLEGEWDAVRPQDMQGSGASIVGTPPLQPQLQLQEQQQHQQHQLHHHHVGWGEHGVGQQREGANGSITLPLQHHEQQQYQHHQQQQPQQPQQDEGRYSEDEYEHASERGEEGEEQHEEEDNEVLTLEGAVLVPRPPAAPPPAPPEVLLGGGGEGGAHVRATTACQHAAGSDEDERLVL